MIKVLIGHRGVGKSSLLQRLESYGPGKFFDLDSYIAESEKKSISDIFKIHSEDYFRDLEIKYFFQIYDKFINDDSSDSIYIALGAGFDVYQLPSDIQVIFVSRRTDSEGRLFLNRPRLNPEMSALAESCHRYSEREFRYRQKAHLIYHMPEGLSQKCPIEEKFFNQQYIIKKAYFTLSQEYEFNHFSSLTKFELRSDLFSLNEMKRLIKKHSDKNFLISIRSQLNADQLLNELRYLKYDWALELGDPPSVYAPAIVSIHDGHFDLALEKIKIYNNSPFHLKFCPVVKTWAQLIRGYHWWLENPEQRSFLPRTDHFETRKSRWRWFRIFMLNRQKINFIQSSIDFDDQPSLYEYLQNQMAASESFAAVLGDPVHQSMTPVTHFKNLNQYADVLSIPLEANDFELAFPFLDQLGLKFAAVTSPLKIKTAQKISEHRNAETFESFSYEAVNTLFKSSNSLTWLATSTDEHGLDQFLKKISPIVTDQSQIIVWGGQGVLSALTAKFKNKFKKFIPYSARTGEPKLPIHEMTDQILRSVPDILIWAAPRSSDVKFPPADWNPQVVIDLNYTSNSMGLEYAMTLNNVNYISGHEMFYQQAEKQAEFWNHFLHSEPK